MKTLVFFLSWLNSRLKEPLKNSQKANSVNSENRLAPISVSGLEMGNRRVGYFVAHAESHPTQLSFSEAL